MYLLMLQIMIYFAYLFCGENTFFSPPASYVQNFSLLLRLKCLLLEVHAYYANNNIHTKIT